MIARARERRKRFMKSAITLHKEETLMRANYVWQIVGAIILTALIAG